MSEGTSYQDRLRKKDWEVRTVSFSVVKNLTEQYHYAKGGSNTATYRHGLFRRGSLFDEDCVAIAWWLPPTKSAALATYPEKWQGVLALSRLVVVPGVPKNACTFLMARSIAMIDRDKWPCLVTYADEWQGHTGTIYRAANWQEVGKTKPQATFILNGRMISRKAGPKTRTRQEMAALGAEMIGSFSKRKFVNIVRI